MDLLRRLIGTRGPAGRRSPERGNVAPEPADRDGSGAVVAAAAETAAEIVQPALPCPSCGTLLDPPPERSRRCPRCRQPIVVRHLEGRLVLLSASAVAVFDAERRREADEVAWSAARAHWLVLGRELKVPLERRERLAAAPISAEVVRSARGLYLAAAQRAVREARRAKHWGAVGQIRRAQAEALFHEAGRPVPPPQDVVALHREGMVAVLRSLALVTRDVELVSSGCCRPCRADDGLTARVTDEVRAARLPHDGCPRGLCGCDWWPAVGGTRKRRRRSHAVAPPPPAEGPP